MNSCNIVKKLSSDDVQKKRIKIVYFNYCAYTKYLLYIKYIYKISYSFKIINNNKQL